MRFEFLALMIPILALSIPIVAILVTHQQKMAQLMHDRRAGQGNAELADIQRELAELKALVHQQSIAVDNLASAQTRMASRQASEIEQRLG